MASQRQRNYSAARGHQYGLLFPDNLHLDLCTDVPVQVNRHSVGSQSLDWTLQSNFFPVEIDALGGQRFSHIVRDMRGIWLTPDDIDPRIVGAAAITYLEGYLWDPPKAKEAFRVASEYAHGAGRQVAITLSDVFCVDRYRQEFLGLLQDGAVDIVFANQHEALALYETSDLGTALDLLAQDARLAVVTMSEQGSMVMKGEERIEVPAAPVGEIVDLTGAGDQYAAGFLYGLAKGAALDRCAALGSLAAAEVIGHVGARPQRLLADLAAQSGLGL